MKSEEYNKMYEVEENHWWFRGLREILFQFLNSDPSERSRVKILDAGCGTGMTAKFLCDKGFSVTGIDISKEATDLAKSRGLENIVKGSLCNMPFDDNYFHIVVLLDVLGALDNKDVRKALNEIFRILKPNGHAIFQVSAFARLHSPHDMAIDWKRRYAKREFLGLFNPKKWRVEKVSYRIFFLFPLIAISKILKRLAKSSDSPSSDLYPLFPPLNMILYLIQRAENFLFSFINFPFGTSIFLVAKKRGF